MLGGDDVVVAVEPQRRAAAGEAADGGPRLAAERRQIHHVGREPGLLEQRDEGGDALGVRAPGRVLRRDLDQPAGRLDEAGPACGDPGADVARRGRRHVRAIAIGSPPRGVSEIARANTTQRCDAE